MLFILLIKTTTIISKKKCPKLVVTVPGYGGQNVFKPGTGTEGAMYLLFSGVYVLLIGPQQCNSPSAKCPSPGFPHQSPPFPLDVLAPSHSTTHLGDPLGALPDLSLPTPGPPSLTTFPVSDLRDGAHRLLTPGPDSCPPVRLILPSTYRLKIGEDFGAAASPRSAQTQRPSAPLPVGERLPPRVRRRPGTTGGGAEAGPTTAPRGARRARGGASGG